jgi:ring-1,2-phenylacetyl-CoA epoxidase subunit PaaD
MVTVSTDAYDAAAAVVDPELQVVTIAELGILRGVERDGDGVVVTITPTYSGCPAMDTIRSDVVAALHRAGYPRARVVTGLHPAWTTDWITEAGRAKLAAAGIAPPGPAAGPRTDGPVLLRLTVRCPRCGAAETEELSRFGSTSCKALWRCRRCAEPFEHLKAF